MLGNIQFICSSMVSKITGRWPQLKPLIGAYSQGTFRYNKNIQETMGLNQWRNTDTVIDWFKSIHNKHLRKFVIFGIITLLSFHY